MIHGSYNSRPERKLAICLHSWQNYAINGRRLQVMVVRSVIKSVTNFNYKK